MDKNFAENKRLCPNSEIAAYLDGELSPSAEFDLEKHFAKCQSCLAELNLQKKMLFALGSAFDEKNEIELPSNFAKIVATAAETKVSGLRSKKERLVAFFLCLVMLLIAAVGLGGETEKVLTIFRNFGEQLIAVAGFVFRLVYSAIFGISVILKALSQQIVFSSAFSFLLITALFFACIVALSKLTLRDNRQ